MKKREVFFLFMVFPVALFYVFFNYFTEEKFSKKPLATMEDSFDHLLGLEGGEDPFIKTEKDRDDLRFYQKLYEKNKSYQFLSSPVLKIPTEVHLIWLGPRSFPKESIKHIRSWISYHPNWTFHFWTDRERPPPCNSMQVHYVKDFSFQFLKKYYDLSNNWGEKSDILRYEILYQEGGVYIDHDASCLRSFYPLHAGYDFYACLERPHRGIDNLALTAGIGIIGAKPHHPILKGAIEAVKNRWEEVTQKFSDQDPLIQAQRVVHRTYIALTLSLKENIGKEENRDIILPAYYFYPRRGDKGFYSHHDYKAAWHEMGMTGDQEMFLESLKAVRKRDAKILSVEGLSLLALLGCFILYFLTNRRIKCKEKIK